MFLKSYKTDKRKKSLIVSLQIAIFHLFLYNEDFLGRRLLYRTE